VGDELTEAIMLINEHKTDLFDIPDILADSDMDILVDSVYGSEGSNNKGLYSDQLSSEPENPNSLGDPSWGLTYIIYPLISRLLP
jgi:hypothetical protein